MSNFTEGPWVAKGGEVCTVEYEDEGQIMHDHICCCEVINGESPNANLIAAAPELLEALQAVMFDVIANRAAISDERISEIRAAIAKALGQ